MNPGTNAYRYMKGGFLLPITRAITGLALLFAAIPAEAKYVYARYNATGANNHGTSWADAYTDLETAIAGCAGGDVLRIAQGTYKPSFQSKTFNLNSGISVYGGYAGTGTYPDAYDPVLYRTILSGEIGDPNSSADNSPHVIVAYPGVWLDGVTVEGGYSLAGGESFGAGLRISSGSIWIQNCLFRNNFSGDGGGAIGIGQLNADGNIGNTTFDNNTSTNGAGAIDFDNFGSFRFTIKGCVFTNNRSGSGSIHAFGYAPNTNLSIWSSTFTANTSTNGGGALTTGGLYLDLQNTILNQNTSPKGGAISVTANGSVFSRNNIFKDNTSTVSPGKGGAVYLEYTQGAKFINCIFQANKATLGGAIFVDHESDFKSRSTSFVSNIANSKGGAVHLTVSHAEFESSIIYFNNSVSGYNVYSAGPENFMGFAFNDIQGGPSGAGTVTNGGIVNSPAGNIDTDPFFVSNTNLRLKTTSPLVNAGAPDPQNLSDYLLSNGDGGSRYIDLDNTERFAGGRIDIGPYENANATNFVLYGRVIDVGTGSQGIEGALVQLFTDTRVFSAITDASGNYWLEGIPTSNLEYGIQISRGCYTTLNTTVPGHADGINMRDFYMSPGIDFTYSPSAPSTGRTVTFSPTADCPDVIGYSWNLDVNNPPFPASTLKNPAQIYQTAGTKTVRLTVARANDLPPLTATRSFNVSTCALSGPTFTLIKLGPVDNTCAGGLSQEPIGYSVRVVQDMCLDASIGAVTWKNNGTTQTGTALDNVINLNLGKNSVTANVAYTFNGQSKTRSLGPVSDKLTQSCGMDQFNRPFIYPKELKVEEKREITGQTTTYRQVEGNVITDEDNNGVKVKLTSNLVPSCACRFQITFVKINHKSEGGEFNYAISPIDDIVLPRGRHKFDLIFTIKDIVTGVVTNDHQEREIWVLPPDPEMVHTRFSCGTPASVDEAFWRQRIAAEELDFSELDHKLKASGQDFSGILDDGRFKRDLVSGDFQVQTAVAYRSNMNAGLMIRENESAWSPMVFFGHDNAGMFISYRTEYRKPTSRIDVSGRAAQTCLRITRTGETLEFFSRAPIADPANAARLTCPVTGWNRVEVPTAGMATQISGWPMLARVGLAASGNSVDEARFNDLRIEGQVNGSTRTWVNLLKQPQTIYNTRFSDGNLVSNWSFENKQNWMVPIYTTPAIGYYSIVPHTDAVPAFEGRFFARYTNKVNSNSMITPRLPVYFENDGRAANEFLLKAMVRTSIANVYPRIKYIYENGGSGSGPAPAPYPTGSGWSKYEVKLSPPSTAVAFQVELVDESVAFTGTLDLDNIILTPLFGGEKNVGVTTVTFADGVDRQFQTIRYGAGEDVVKATILDGQSRSMRELPPYAVSQISDLTGYRKAKSDPVHQFELYHAQDDEAGASGSKDAIDVKPTLEEFRPGFGTTYLERSPLERLSSVLGPLVSYDIVEEYKNDIPATSTDPATVGDRTVRKLYAYLGQAETSPRTREDNLDAFGGLAEFVIKGKPLDAGATTCEGLPAATNLNCKDRVVKNDLDILNRAWKSTPPSAVSTVAKDPDFSQFKVYNTLGNAISFEQKSGSGKSESMFGPMGELRFTRDANKLAAREFISYEYDPFGRLKSIRLVSDPTGSLWDQINADDPEWPGEASWAQLLIQNIYDEPPEIIPVGLNPWDMRNLRGNLSASICYTQHGAVSKYFSYDDDGGPESSWLKIINLPLQKLDTRYNSAKLIVRTEVTGNAPNQSPISKVETQTYDDMLRPEATYGNSQGAPLKPLVRHTYWADGKVRYSRLGQGLGHGIAYAYDPASRLIQQRHEKLDAATGAYSASGVYEQKLAWNYQNNVSQQSIYNGAVSEKYRGFMYTYDHFGNLIKSNYGKSTSGWSDDEANAFYQPAALDESMSYDEDNSLSSLGRGGIAPIPYRYYGNSYRLERAGDGTQIVAPGQRVRAGSRNFVYDGNGNMILDRSAKRRFEYDFRNLVTKVIQCSALAGDDCNGVSSVSEFLYDDEGKRVAKLGKK